MSVWIGVAILLLGNALYVAAEFGAVGVRRSRVRRLSDDGHWLAKKLLPFVDDPVALDRYVGASQIGISITSLMLGAFANARLTAPLVPVLAASLALDDSAALRLAPILVLVALTALQLVLGELVPKALALQYPTQTALATVMPMRWSLRLFRPFNALLNGTANILLRLLGAKMDGHRHLHSPEEIDLLIAESRDGGLLEPEEQQRLRRALRLGRRRARDVMVPISRLTMVPVDADWDEVLRIVAASAFSRLPVYRGAPTQIIGALRVKDLVTRYVAEGPVPTEKLVRPLPQVAEDLPADRIVGVLRERRSRQAVVTDAAGRSIGVVNFQDVLTELLETTADGAESRR